MHYVYRCNVHFIQSFQLAHQLMNTHKIVHIKTFKIAPKCFNYAIIIRELRCSLLKPITKLSLIDFPILNWFCGSLSVIENIFIS